MAKISLEKENKKNLSKKQIHNLLLGLQGGDENNRYHSTKEEHDYLKNITVSNPTFVTRTDQLENTGEDNTSRYVQESEINDLVIGAGLADKSFEFYQSFATTVWTINHPLQKKVAVTITDTAGTVIMASVVINNDTQVVIKFNKPVAGYAILN